MYHGMLEGPMSDDDYRAHEDAEAMARVKEINADPMRKKAAQAAAASRAEMMMKEARAMKKTAAGMKEKTGKSWPKMPGITGAH